MGAAGIRMERYQEPPVHVTDEKLMFRMIRASLNQRRKTMVNGLVNSDQLIYTKDEVIEALKTMGKDPAVRGETLTLEEFAELSNILV